MPHRPIHCRCWWNNNHFLSFGMVIDSLLFNWVRNNMYKFNGLYKDRHALFWKLYFCNLKTYISIKCGCAFVVHSLFVLTACRFTIKIVPDTLKIGKIKTQYINRMDKKCHIPDMVRAFSYYIMGNVDLTWFYSRWNF